jgi:hypothetical protein
MIELIVTNDYEVRGDGSGDVEAQMIRTTAEILDVCEQYGVPHTLFVDVVELWRFREAEAEGRFGPAYRAASLIEDQLRDALCRGHDAQLHLHPQWIDAEPITPTSWRVSEQYWRLPNVPNGLGTADDPRSLRGLFVHGRRTLEDLLRPVAPDYRCIAFRAGGYCIQPEAGPLTAMREAGFLVDSSVSVGRWVRKPYARYDYRDAPCERSHWHIDDTVTSPALAGDLIEAPVFTHWVRSRAARALGRKGVPNLPCTRSTTAEGRISSRRLRRLTTLFAPRRVNLDFCKLTADEMIAFCAEARQRFRGEAAGAGSAPVVMIGHSKEWAGSAHLRRFLDWAAAQEWIGFTTFPAWLDSRSRVAGEGEPGEAGDVTRDAGIVPERGAS